MPIESQSVIQALTRSTALGFPNDQLEGAVLGDAPILFASLRVGQSCILDSRLIHQEKTIPDIKVTKISDGNSDPEVFFGMYFKDEASFVVAPNAEVTLGSTTFQVYVAPTAMVWPVIPKKD